MNFPMPVVPGEWPASNADFDVYYDGLRRHRLVVQKCDGCDAVRFPPGPMCATCGALEWTGLESGGVGEIYSFTVQHRPAVPPFAQPHAMALVAFPEGFRIALSYAGPEPTIGAKVDVMFVDGENGVVFPIACGSG